MPLEETVATSDIVVIDTVASLDRGDDKPRNAPQYAVVTVTPVLKGTAPQPIRVRYRGPVAEEYPACCAVGKQYLFFLRKMPDSNYVSTNHRLGIVDLTPAAVEPHH